MLTLGSCATIFTGSKAKVIFDSNVQRADVFELEGKRHSNVTFPYQTKVKRGFNESLLKVEAQGYEPFSLIIDKTFNAVSVLNLLSLLGWGIDAATGAMMKPEQKNYFLDLQKSTTKSE